MTDQHNSDADDGSAVLTRRQALAAAGIAGLLGVDPLTAAQDSGESGVDEAKYRWTARRREKYVRYSDGRYEGDGTWSTSEHSEEDSVPVHSVDAVSSLEYLGAQYHPYVNPAGDDSGGSWQHTFVLSTFGLGQVLYSAAFARSWDGVYDEVFEDLEVAASNEEDTVTVTGRPVRYVPRGFDVTPGFAVQAVGPDADDGVVDPVAVSARRDLDLFRFFDPEPIVEEFDVVEENREPDDEPPADADEGRFDALGDRIATRRARAQVDLASVSRRYERAQQRLEEGNEDSLPVGPVAKGLEQLLSLAAAADEYRNGGEISVPALATVDHFLSGYGTLDAAVTMLTAVGELADGPARVDEEGLRFFNGFEQYMPGDTMSAGAGVVMFDVFVAPGAEGEVDITPKLDVGPADDEPVPRGLSMSANELDPTWTVRVRGPEAADEDAVEPEQLYDAEIVDADFPSVSDYEDPWHGPTDWPTESTKYETRPRRPSPSIDPAGGVSVEYEEVDDEPQELWVVPEDEPVAFDAHHTVLCGGPIQHYEWELLRLEDGEPVEQLDADDGADLTVFETTVPPLGPDEGVRVRLTVTDADDSVATSRDLVVEEAGPPEAEVVQTTDQPVAGEELQFDGSGSSTPAGEIESMHWDVPLVPESIRDAIDGAPDYVWSDSGETFSFVPPEPGEYAVSLTVTDSRGYVRSDSVTVEVAEGADAVIEPRFDEPRAEQTLRFDGSASSVPSGTVDSYDWSVADAPSDVDVELDVATGQVAELTPPTAGTYAVELVVTDGDRTDDAVHEVEVLEAPDVTPDFSVTPGPAEVEGGDEVNLEAVADPADVERYDWTVERWPRADDEAVAEVVLDADGATAGFEAAGGWFYRVTLDVEGTGGAVTQQDVTLEVETVDLTLSDGSRPTDVDGDGRYRDVTGDETVDQLDVVTFFENQHRAEFKRPELFDYTGNGDVGHGDVVALFEWVVLN